MGLMAIAGHYLIIILPPFVHSARVIYSAADTRGGAD